MIFDIEADSLNPTKIHCLSYSNGDGRVRTLTDYDNMRKFLLSQKVLIGHSITLFDIPVLERLLGIKIKAQLIDTLALSWYLYPHRPRHGLDEWGRDLGVDKPKVDDWENLPLEVYINRCEEDVKINSLLWEKEKGYLELLYNGSYSRIIGYLTFKMNCMRSQQECGWKLDIDKAKEGLKELSEERDIKLKKLSEVMPKVSKVAVRYPPAKPYKKNGELSATGEKWFKLLKENNLPNPYWGGVEVVTKEEVGNPSSSPQIKKWLYDLGWKPVTFKHNRNKETNEIKKVEQVNLPDGKGLCPSVKKLYPKEPALELLDGLSILNHRIPILEGFLNKVDDRGFIKAQAQGFTNTLRFKHKSPCVNLPGVDKAYGKLIRGCLTAPEGYELCGSDQSSLEDRTKQHFMYEFDPDYVNEMNKPDFDPHLDIGVMSGMMTQDQSDSYKSGDMSVKPLRHDCKQVNYSCTYGVTPSGIVRNTGMSLEKATKLHQTYWKRNWAIDEIVKNVRTKTVRGVRWLYNPVSKFWYEIRFDKDKFSTLNQGTGTYCFDRWVYYVSKSNDRFTAQFHDEIVLCVKKGNREETKKILKNAVAKTNKELKLNRELDVDVQFGNDYSQIH